ncbi:unnamed protein product [Rotaria sp. Silwood1]|nr:unnamed protein product [Rotaria sp. Silwood1]CAF1080821.1 unnamed protein product [Rotaria sp. Silwood1]CAF3440063.1 unnamed protein product [Rotaria sp. Silwood1]CAF4568908.1 unnamed protein product [Rotaria sp. Silwood1]CAF4619482.1 unnamed protein product [Rotaria sp. Silwood1]
MLNDSYVEQIAMGNGFLNKLIQISFPYIIIVSVIGICGNFLTIVMLSTKSLSKNFNNCTLIALALTDLVFNFTLVSRCINDLTRSNNEQLCRLLSFLSHLAELLSACFTAQFTAQRFIAVRFPLSVFIEKRIHLIHYLIVTLFIIFGISYCLLLVKTNAYDNCHEELELNWFISDALLSFLIPFTIIIILNILIIFYLKKRFQNNQQYRFTKRQQQSEMIPLDILKVSSSRYEITVNTKFQANIYDNINISNSRSSNLQNQSHTDLPTMHGRVRSLELLHRSPTVCFKSQSYRVTRMLILVSTCFLLFNAPAHICTIGLKIYTLKQTIFINDVNETVTNLNDNFKQYNETSSTLSNNIDFSHTTKDTSEQNDTINHLKWMKLFYIMTIITQHISYTSYSINFFLYSFCGMKFRRELLKCMLTQRRQLPTTRSVTL